MPIVAELPALLKRRESLAEPIPPNYDIRAQSHELTVRFSTVPLSHKLPSLLREVNTERKPEDHITVGNIITASREFEQDQMRWQSIRLYDEKKGFQNLTGWEHFYIGRNFDNVDVALRIALLGLQAQREHPTVINKILIGGFGSLNTEQLIETSSIIGKLLKQEKQNMTENAKQFRKDTLTSIQSLPIDLTRSYYYQGHDSQIIAVATVMQQLPPHPSIREPIQWQMVFERARRHKINDYNVQDLQRGRSIIDLLGHGMGSFSQGFIQLIKK